MFKELLIKMVCATGITAQSIPALMDKEGIDFEPIETINWQEYPYRPKVYFRMAYSNDALLVHYKVTEKSVAAVAGCDNGNVWEDSCVEFLTMPDEKDGVYYNYECNCVGRLLIGGGVPGNRTHAEQNVIDTVDRWASLGKDDFEERIGECTWEVALIIPLKTLFLHNITSLKGKTFRANFYKCGDKLQTPHFLSWSPIGLPHPNFHCPQFFGKLIFE